MTPAVARRHLPATHQRPGPSPSAPPPAAAHAVWLWLATSVSGLGCALAMTLYPVSAAAAGVEGGPAVQSPYFHVRSDTRGVDALPLKATQVNVRIQGVIADVTVLQTYRNEGSQPIEARYVFPGSTRAAVQGLSVRLGDRLITASIREKQQAVIEYETAKSQGKTAALLEQHQPNVFQMNVAHILPGDDVKVELRYTELLVPTDGRYQFVFPTVVGPRYNGPAGGHGAAWAGQPYLPPGSGPTSSASAQPAGADRSAVPAFDLRVSLQTPVPVKELSSPSHAVRAYREEGGDQVVTLDLRTDRPDNRDFILDYRLAGDHIESGLLLYRGATENFFLALVEPPKAPPPTAISPREYIFVVDVSGSMHGFPLETAKGLLRELTGGLRPSDSFNVLLFSGSNRFLSPQSVPATRANIEQAMRLLGQQPGGGGTELIPALRRVMAQPRSADLSRSVVIVTDGYVTVEREAFELVRQNLSHTNVFAFGIGSSVNRHLIEGLARAGMGEPFIVTRPDEAAPAAQRFRAMIDSPLMTQVKVRFEGLDVYDVEPRQLPDLLAQRPVVVFGKWRGEARGRLVVEGMTPAGLVQQTLEVASAPQVDTAALRQLWARHRIASLSDQEALEGGDAQAAAITRLGLQYSLLTAYTSFVAVDHVVRNPDPAGGTVVQQPLPLPQGVEATAVGAAVPSTPEPATWGAMLLTLSVLVLLARRRQRDRARPHRLTR